MSYFILASSLQTATAWQPVGRCAACAAVNAELLLIPPVDSDLLQRSCEQVGALCAQLETLKDLSNSQAFPVYILGAGPLYKTTKLPVIMLKLQVSGVVG